MFDRFLRSKKGQNPLVILVGAIAVLAMAAIFSSVLQSVSCQDEKGQISTCQTQNAELMQQIGVQQNALNICSARLDTCQFNLETCSSNLSICQNTSAQLSQDLDSTRNELRQTRGDLHTCGEELTDCQLGLSSCQQNASACQEAYAALQQKYQIQSRPRYYIIKVYENYITVFNLFIYHWEMYVFSLSIGIGLTFELFKIRLRVLGEEQEKKVSKKIRNLLSKHPWLLFWITIIIIVAQNAYAYFFQ